MRGQWTYAGDGEVIRGRGCTRGSGIMQGDSGFMRGQWTYAGDGEVIRGRGCIRGVHGAAMLVRVLGLLALLELLESC
jgi:hypothetical protein